MLSGKKQQRALCESGTVMPFLVVSRSRADLLENLPDKTKKVNKKGNNKIEKKSPVGFYVFSL